MRSLKTVDQENGYFLLGNLPIGAKELWAGHDSL